MEYADLAFTDDGTPTSVRFDDIYFSKGQGAAETHYVFIEQNHLPERFAALEDEAHFTIAETGFGTGLNFLVAWQQFLQHAPTSARLTFVSCEKYPLRREDLVRIYQQWPAFAEQTQALQAAYPPALSGFHLLEFDRVNLLLMFDDAANAFAELSASVDAWFLDGFAPSKNPDMWQPALFQQMQRLSHTKTTVATFTAARLVRDGLSGAGFALTKVKGFGKKRDMLKGEYRGLCGPIPYSHWPSSELPVAKPNRRKRIAVIGAGLAGVTSAIELKKRGYEVTLFDQHPKAAQGGSGNSQGAVYAKLSAHYTVATQFYAQALIVAQRQLSALPDEVAHGTTGLVQLVHNQTEVDRLQKHAESSYIPAELATIKSAAELSALTGVTVQDAGMWFPQGGWVSPAQWVHYLAQSHKVTCEFSTQIISLSQQESGWYLRSSDQREWLFDQVVLCTAFDALHFNDTAHLPLNTIAGQITQLSAHGQHHQLKAVICTDRYVMPVHNETLTVGSTFRMKSTDITVTEADHLENIRNLRQRIPGLLNDDEVVVSGRAAVRCNAPDYLPLLGPVSPASELAEQFRIPLQRNLAHKEPAAKHLPGLWVNLAHGSKGLCSSHLSAKLLAAMIHGEPLPVQVSLVQALNPNRFVVRALLREKRQKIGKAAQKNK